MDNMAILTRPTGMLALISCLMPIQPTWPQSSDAGDKYPDRPIKIVVPTSAGSALDVVSRLVSDKVGTSLGQRVYVENQPGGAGIIALRGVARAAPDGYTITIVTGSLVTVIPNMKDVGFDTFKDFTPVVRLAKIPQGLIAHPQLAPRSVAELVSLARQKPGTINYGTGGPGSPQHIAMELLSRSAGIQMTHVPFRNVSGAINSVVAGDISIMFTAMSAVKSLVADNRVRLLGISTPERVAQFGDVPTVAEAGAPGFSFVDWCAFLAPANTPQSIVNKLNAATLGALEDPAARVRLMELGFEIGGSTPDQLAAALRQDFTKMRELVREANIRE
jgi:tripartite-type tricarboxylate transporter receptor subunit TctC